jgi:hypothetical protein
MFDFKCFPFCFMALNLMKNESCKNEKRHGRARSDWQIRDAMTTASIPNNYLNKAMQRSIRELEKSGFTLRWLRPVDPLTGTEARDFVADFTKHTLSGLLVFSVRIDTDGNVTNINPQPTK